LKITLKRELTILENGTL